MPRFPRVPITQEDIEDARKQLSNEVPGSEGLYPLIKKHGKKILKIEKKYSSNEEERDELEIDLEEPIREKRKNKHLTDEQIREKIQSFNEILRSYKNDIEKEEETIKTFYEKLRKNEFESKLNLDELDELLIRFKLVMTEDPDSRGLVPMYRKLYEFRNPSFEIYFDEEREGELPEDVVARMTPISRSEYESNAMLGQPGNPDDYNYVDYSGGAKKSRKKRKSRKSKKVKKTHKSKKMHKTKKGQRGRRGQKRKTRKQK